MDFEELNTLVNGINLRLANVEPIVKDLTTRVTNVETTSLELKALSQTNHALIVDNTEKTQEILDIVAHAKGVGAFVRKHGPRLVAFVVGSLVASGRLGEPMAQLIKQFIGA